jgi:hypothetical protein
MSRLLIDFYKENEFTCFHLDVDIDIRRKKIYHNFFNGFGVCVNLTQWDIFLRDVKASVVENLNSQKIKTIPVTKKTTVGSVAFSIVAASTMATPITPSLSS